MALTVEHFELDNGMNVVVIPDHRAPVVVHSVWYNIGSADEPGWRPDKTGIAHMLEHLMFKGTDKVPVGQFDKVVERHGGEMNAFTSYDYTAYYEKVSVDNLEKMMELEADRMANLKLADEDFQPERDVVLEERRWRTDSKPQSRFYEEFIHKHMPTHPYGLPIIGWQEDIENYTVDDAFAWYKSFYGPNNATLILAGDVTADQVRPMVEKHYGAVAARELDPAKREVEPARNEAVVFDKTDPEVQVPVFYRVYRAPSVFAGIAGAPGNAQDAIALWMLSEVVGGSQTARMYQKLVVEQQLANSASTHFDPDSKGESSFDVFLQPKPSITLKQLEEAANAVLADVQDNGVTAEELNRVRTQLLADDIYARDDLFNGIYRMGNWVLAGGEPDEFLDWRNDVQQVTPADLQRVAQQYLVLEQSSTGRLVADASQLGE